MRKMDSLFLTQTLLGVLPSDLQGVVSGFVNHLHVTVAKPITHEEIKWLLESVECFTLFYYDDQSCELHPWERHGIFHEVLSRRSTYSTHQVASRHMGYSTGVSLDDFEELVIEITKGASISCEDDGKLLGIGFLDVQSYFLLMQKRLPSADVEMVRRITLEYLNKMMERLQEYPVALEAYLLGCTGVYADWCKFIYTPCEKTETSNPVVVLIEAIQKMTN